jgi:hypothetical protein
MTAMGYFEAVSQPTSEGKKKTANPSSAITQYYNLSRISSNIE